jgi:MFS family permease
MAAATTVISLFVPETAPVALRPKDPTGQPQRSPLIHRAGLLPGSLLLAGTWGMAGFLAFVPLYLESVGMGAAGPVLAEYALIVVSLRIVFVRLPDQVGAVPLSAFALVGSALGMTILGVVRDPAGVYLGTAVFAAGIAFLFPALLAVAVSRVDENERGSVVGTTTAFVDLSFGISPAVLGFLAGSIGLAGAWIVSAVIAAVGAAVLAVRRDSLVHTPEPA